jgi:type II secretory pathway component PulF
MIITFLIFVIPKISKMYKDARVELPALTKKIINISTFLQENYHLLI